MKINKKNKKMKMVALFFVFIGIISFVILYNNAISKPLKSSDNIVSIEVKTGAGFYDILNRLF